MSVISLGDAKRHLNISGTEHDGEVQETLNRAEGMIARRVGPLVQGAVTERVRGSGGTVRLSQPPVQALTAVTDQDGVPVDTAGAIVTRSGVVDGLPSRTWYDVTYTAGWGTPLPAGIIEGILAMTQHLWSTQRGAARRPGAAVGGDRVGSSVPGAAYVWPFRVTEAIADYIQVGV